MAEDVFSIIELREEICNYLDIRTIANLHICFGLVLPLKYSIKLMKEYDKFYLTHINKIKKGIEERKRCVVCEKKAKQGGYFCGKCGGIICCNCCKYKRCRHKFCGNRVMPNEFCYETLCANCFKDGSTRCSKCHSPFTKLLSVTNICAYCTSCKKCGKIPESPHIDWRLHLTGKKYNFDRDGIVCFQCDLSS